MTEKSKALIPETLQFTAQMNLDKSDIVKVAVAHGERMLKKQFADLTRQADEFEKKRKELDNELDAIAKKVFTSKALERKIADLRKALDVLATEEIAIETNVIFNRPAKENFFKIFLHAKTPHDGNLCFDIHKTVKPATKRQLAILEEINTLTEKHKANIQMAAEVRKKLADIPSLERQAHAALVESELAQTKDGKALIDAVTRNLEDTIKLLG